MKLKCVFVCLCNLFVCSFILFCFVFLFATVQCNLFIPCRGFKMRSSFLCVRFCIEFV